MSFTLPIATIEDLEAAEASQEFNTPISASSSLLKILSFEGINTRCNDIISGQILVGDGFIQQIHLNTSGCTLSKVSATFLCQQILGQKVNEITTIDVNVMVKVINATIPMRQECVLVGPRAIIETLRQL